MPSRLAGAFGGSLSPKGAPPLLREGGPARRGSVYTMARHARIRPHRGAARPPALGARLRPQRDTAHRHGDGPRRGRRQLPLGPHQEGLAARPADVDPSPPNGAASAPTPSPSSSSSTSWRTEDVSCSKIFSQNWKIAPLLFVAGTEDQKQRYLPRYRDEDDFLLSFPVTEPNVGADVMGYYDAPAGEGIRTTAIRDGDHYVVNGVKQWGSARRQRLGLDSPGAHRPQRPRLGGRQLPQSSRRGRRASAWARSTTRSGGAPTIRPSCSSMTHGFPRRTCSAAAEAYLPPELGRYQAAGNIEVPAHLVALARAAPRRWGQLRQRTPSGRQEHHPAPGGGAFHSGDVHLAAGGAKPDLACGVDGEPRGGDRPQPPEGQPRFLCRDRAGRSRCTRWTSSAATA